MKTCEEYVLNELKETKEELELVKNDKKVLEEEHQVALAGYKMLIDLVVNATKDFKLEDDGTYIKVFWREDFITLERKDSLGVIKNLVALIEKGQSIPRREEND